MPKRRLLQAREVPWQRSNVAVAGRGADTTQQAAQAAAQTYAAGVIVIPVGALTAANVQRALEDLVNYKLAVTGGSMSGALMLWRDPQADLEAATKQYVDTATQELSVRDVANVPILVASAENNSAQFGPSTTENIEYRDGVVRLAGVPIGDLVAQAGIGAGAVRVEATPYTLTTNDCIIIGTGTDELTLPAVTDAAGRYYTIKRLDEGYLIADADVVDFGSTHFIMKVNEVITVVSDGSNWHVIGRVTW